MYHAVIFTVGISALHSRNYFGEMAETHSINIKDLTDEETMTSFLRKIRHDLENENIPLSRFGAECSILDMLQKERKLQEHPQIELIYSDTLKGKVCARLIRSLLEIRLGSKVSLNEIEHLNVNDRHQLRRSLGHFMEKLSYILEKYDKHYACFVPLGGYKIMTSFAYFVASFHGYPSTYMFEEANLLHQISPLPIALPTDFVEKNAELLKKMLKETGVEWETLSTQEQTLIHDHPSLFTVENHLVTLNLFTLFLLDQKQFRKYLKTSIMIDRAEKETFQRKEPGHWSFVLSRIEKMVEHLNSGYHDAYHEWQQVRLPEDCHLYKSPRVNHLIFRAIWYKDEEKDTLYIYKIWLNHEKYDRDIVEGLHGLQKPKQWVSLNDEVYHHSRKGASV